jgi:hypothetical protein
MIFNYQDPHRSPFWTLDRIIFPPQGLQRRNGRCSGPVTATLLNWLPRRPNVEKEHMMPAPTETETPRKSRRRILVPAFFIAAAATAAVAVQTSSISAHRTDGSTRSSTQAAYSVPGKATTSAGQTDGAEAFTDCMRAGGVADFPGITISNNGQIQLNGGGTINPLSKTYKAAAAKCAHLLPKGSSLPTEPQPPTPPAPTLKFTCTSDCPTPPKTPSAPL